MQVRTCEMSVSELVTLGSLYKHWRNTGISSEKRISFSGRKLFFYVKEAKVTFWGLRPRIQTRRAALSSPLRAHGLRARPAGSSAGRPLLGKRPNHSFGPSLANPCALRMGHSFHKITKIVPPGCNLACQTLLLKGRGRQFIFFPQKDTGLN